MLLDASVSNVDESDEFNEFDDNDESSIASTSEALGASGTYSIAASLPTRAYYDNLNVLPNGNVLHVDWPAAATVYNPATNQWSPVASPPTTFDGSAYVSGRQPDGRVVFAGPSYTITYNPASNNWSSAGGWGADNYHDRGRGLVLQNGKVLVTGGDLAGYIFTTATHLFDPATNLWSSTGNLAYGRTAFAIALLQNGKVLVAGGLGGGQTAELYNPATGTWSATGNTVLNHQNAVAVTLPSGKVLLRSYSGFAPAAEIYDPATGTWSLTGSPVGSGTALTVLPTGKVLQQNGATSELYNPATGTWSPTGSPNVSRVSATAVMNNGGVLLVGGMQGKATPACPWQTCVEIYTP